MTPRIPAAVLAALAFTLTLTACQSTRSKPQYPHLQPPTPRDTPLTTGVPAPNVTLTTTDGNQVTLNQLLEQGPLVVNFYRGNWCPYCNKALDAWSTNADDFKAQGASIIAISPESLPHLNKTQANQSFQLLADPTHSAAKAFGINFAVDSTTIKKYKNYGIDLANHNASQRWDLPIPATFVIDTNGIIKYAYTDPDYSKRADPKQALAAVQSLD